MKPHSRSRLTLEHLEDRCVPAKVTSVNGFLTIINPAGPLTVTAKGPTTFQVKDNLTNAEYQTSKGLVITGTQVKDVVVIDLKGQAFAGSISAALGKGNDEFTLTSSTGPASVGGLVSLGTGAGDDTVFIAPGPGSLTFGNALTVLDPSGTKDAITLGNDSAATAYNNFVTLSGFNSNIIGTGKADRFNSPLTINGIQETADMTVTLGTTSQGIFAGSHVLVTTGNGNDTVTVQGTGSTYSRSLSTYLGAGNDSFILSDATVNGVATVLGNGGNDTLSVDQTALFKKSLLVDLGNGINTFAVDEAFSVGGDLWLSAGQGNNDPFTVSARVSGNLNIFLGSGINGPVTVNGPVTGTFYWRSGNAPHTLNLNGKSNYKVDLVFGGQDDTLNVDLGSATLSGQANGGGRLTSNVFNLISGTLASPFILTNFP